MTREEARKAAEVMMAYADGKDIEFRYKEVDRWDIWSGEDPDPLYFAFDECNYRIKQEPTYRPFKDKEECWAEMQLHQPFGWVIVNNKEDKYKSLITTITQNCVHTQIEGWNFKHCLEKFTFADGTPFGIK